jgi:outer membrane protein
MKKIVFLIGLFISMGMGYAQDQENKGVVIAQSDSLTLEQCIKIGLENQPIIGASQGAIITAESEYTQVLGSRFPQIQLEAGIYATNRQLQYSSTIAPITVPNTSNNKMNLVPSVQMVIKQPIYDFGRTQKALESKTKLIKSAELGLESTKDDVILNVQIAYYNYALTQHIVRINEERVKQSYKHLDRAKGFFEVGKLPESDVSKAELEVANSELDLVDARGKARLAKVTLNSAMGITEISDDPSDYIMATAVVYKPFSANLKESINQALRTRREIEASEMRIGAWRSALSAAKSQYRPIISATAGVGPYAVQNEAVPTKRDYHVGYNIGLNFGFPIFQGLSVRANVAEAQGGIRTATSQANVTKQRVIQEVQERYFSAKFAEERYKASEKIVIQGDKNLALAEGRFETGVGSAIEITDANYSLANAKIERTSALYNYQIELLRFAKAAGVIRKEK